MRYFEMFAGVGGFGIGIQRANPNAHCVGFSEIDPHASSVLRYHYPNIPNHGDCKTINWSEVPDFDLLVGGSPCQDFSIAGKRAGLVGARSGLAYEYIRALEEKHPPHFIWENVRGVLSSNRGWDFAAILNQMAQAGYALQWQVLNAKYFGVPQNRERVFVIGTRSDLGSPREIFFEQGNTGQDTSVHSGEAESAATLTAWYGKNQSDAQYMMEQITPTGTPDAFRVYNPEGQGRTLKGLGGGTGAKTMLIPDDAKIRRLTPIECERLMSWPDGHTAKGQKEDGTVYEVSDTQRYKMCGNGVVSEVVKNLIEHLCL